VFSPNNLTFYPLPLGSSSEQGISVGISGSPVALTSVKLGGPNAGDFAMTNNCSTPLTECEVDITFTPTVSGVRMAEVQFRDNATGSPQIVPLNGFGQAPAQPTLSVNLSPVPIAFSQAVALGSSATASVVVSNTGTQGVVFSDFHIGGTNKGDFGIQSNQCPLSPAPLQAGTGCTVVISFIPKASGIRLATFSVTDNASGSPQSTSIIGEGVAAVKTLAVNPSSETFNPVPVGTLEDGYQINVTNTGTVPVTTGTRNAHLIVSSDASNSPLTVALSGTGQ